jgi:L-iditol 2-dehydrogenase
MRVARLHGIADLRVEELPVRAPLASELLVKIEGCGICPTDIRKYLIGVNDGPYPFNPGHEWVGRVVAVGDDVTGWAVGQRLYGDTYAGYAEYATVPVTPQPWSYGLLRLDDELPLEEAVFIEPLADCLHAVHDQARVGAGDCIVVLGAGQMGLQIIAVAALAGVRVLAVEPRPERQALAQGMGAEAVVEDETWPGVAAEFSSGGVSAVILTLGRGDLVDPALAALAPGGRLVLFAGFGNQGRATVDLNAIHYRELTICGSEWIGTPPHQHPEHYEQARDVLSSGKLSCARLISARCGLDGLEEAFNEVREHRMLKVILNPEAR